MPRRSQRQGAAEPNAPASASAPPEKRSTTADAPAEVTTQIVETDYISSESEQNSDLVDVSVGCPVDAPNAAGAIDNDRSLKKSSGENVADSQQHIGSESAGTHESKSQPRPFASFIDEVSDTQISGWIVDPTQASRRCTIGLKEGDRVVSRAVASTFRQDLQVAGFGDGCYAFSLPMPRSLLDGYEHRLEVVELASGIRLNEEPIVWRSGAGTGAPTLTAAGPLPTDEVLIRQNEPLGNTLEMVKSADAAIRTPRFEKGKRADQKRTHIMFDVSDLVYYIGHHPNLTGIQRVQSSIVLAIIQNSLIQPEDLAFLSYNARNRKWVVIPTGFLTSLLEDLFLPQEQRLVRFSSEDARVGVLPGARDLDGSASIDSGTPSVLCLLGAAWVQRDYFHRVLQFKRRHGTRFVMTIHDLIPIYARETCDQGTARVFEEFLRRALRHVDHFLSVSDNTARDLVRYVTSLGMLAPAITVTRNGSSFQEFLAETHYQSDPGPEDLPDRFVLFVATIEGRKNHRLIFDIWRRMIQMDIDVPSLVCVGRVGWKSETFISDLIETDYLFGKIVLMQDVSDAHLRLMYERSMFTLCPSIYEGWGLPIGESLAAGKICVCSDRASLPEVAGEFGVYLDIDNVEHSLETVRRIIEDNSERDKLEAKIRRSYKPITWQSVAKAIVTACKSTALITWDSPYPYAMVPYSSEISFAWLGREPEGIFGDNLLMQIADTRRGHFQKEPLQELSFLRGEDVRASGSWGEPENWGTWLCQGSGEIILGLPPRDCNIYYVFLRLRAPGPLSELPIHVSVGGSALWTGSLGPRPKDVWFPVRRRVAGSAEWRLRLRVDVDLSADVQAELAATDGRIPVVGFERLIVVPEDDLKLRLDILYALLL